MLSIGQLPETDLPQNRNEAEIKAFFGLVRQFSDFSDKIAKLTEPLCLLLKDSYLFNWEAEAVH